LNSPTSNPLIIIAAVAIIGGLGYWTFRKFGAVTSGILVLILGGTTLFFWIKPNFNTNLTLTERALALANPQPTQVNLPGTEIEANNLTKIFPGSEAYLGTQATLETFKIQAPRFPILHLGTHGCFNLNGCRNLDMKANTILFANKEEYNIADAALLGLKNTELITLSACET
jgi:CHAT domain-containing protein